MSRLATLGHKLYTGDVSVGFVPRRRTWYAVSGVLVLVAVAAVLLRGLDFSIEFRGGVDFQAPVSSGDATEAIPRVRNAVVRAGVADLDEPIVTAVGDDTVRVETVALGTDDITKVRRAIGEAVGAKPSDVAYSSIGPTWGAQITNKALVSLGVFLGLVMVVIWLYFREWKMSLAAIVALLHDVLVTVGVYALVGFDVTPATVIGVLTILGYSLYDTVVVFDKVRENTRGITSLSRTTYSEAANLAVNQTLVRSINTSVIALLPVAGILFVGAGLLGAGTLKDLSLALFIGITAGTYSSIFLATPLLCDLKEREPAMQALARRVEQRRRSADRRRPEAAMVGATRASGGAGDAPAVVRQMARVGAGSAKGEAAANPRGVKRSQPRKRRRSARRSKGRTR